MSPHDISDAELVAVWPTAKTQHAEVRLAAFLDGHVKALPKEMDAEALRSMTTIDGGEAIGESIEAIRERGLVGSRSPMPPRDRSLQSRAHPKTRPRACASKSSSFHDRSLLAVAVGRDDRARESWMERTSSSYYVPAWRRSCE